MEKDVWIKGFAREHTFTSIPFFLEAYTKRWKKSVGFIFLKVMVAYEKGISTSYRTEKDLNRLEIFLIKTVKNFKKVKKILNTIQKNRILLINYSEKIAKKDLSKVSLTELRKEYVAFHSLSLKFWDYHSMGYYLTDKIMDLDESEQKQELMIQAQEIRKDMPYIRCEKIILEKLFFETSKRTGIPFELLFYLTPKELLNLFKKPKIAGGLIAVAEERTKFSLFFYTSNSSKIFVDEKARFELKSLFEGIQKNNYEEFFGTIASQGVVKGSIFLVTSKNDLQKIPQNSVVVIEKMMPEDISFIKNAKGVICEEGGLGSHAAILCREYKIPCIVGVKGALTIKSGTTVILDAQKGKITLSE